MTSLHIDDSATVWAGQTLDDGVPLLIVMHGYGAHERDLASLVPLLPDSFAAACIRAPLSLEHIFGAGYAWFPLSTDPGAPALALANEAVAAVMEWLNNVRRGIKLGPIMLLGFSQGGAMVTHLFRHHPEEFGAGVVLSGFTVPGEVSSDERLLAIKPPVFWAYDPADPIVPAQAFQRTAEFCEEYFETTTRIYRVGHGISEQEILDVHEFLSEILKQ